jgi:hypothetical protein
VTQNINRKNEEELKGEKGRLQLNNGSKRNKFILFLCSLSPCDAQFVLKNDC